MSGNRQIHNGPGLVHDAVRDRHFQDMRIDRRVSYLMESTQK